MKSVRYAALAVLTLLASCAQPAFARDGDQWESTPFEIKQWYMRLMQPDHPRVSCCGEADAYYADSFEVEGDHYVAIITDNRPDELLGRPHIDIGTRIPVPNYKLKTDDGNPTGHGVIFVGSQGQVFCYIAPGGV